MSDDTTVSKIDIVQEVLKTDLMVRLCRQLNLNCVPNWPNQLMFVKEPYKFIE